jgi:hypothetical protein
MDLVTSWVLNSLLGGERRCPRFLHFILQLTILGRNRIKPVRGFCEKLDFLRIAQAYRRRGKRSGRRAGDVTPHLGSTTRRRDALAGMTSPQQRPQKSDDGLFHKGQ